LNCIRRRLGAAAGLLCLLLGGCAGTPPLPPGFATHPELAEVASEPSVLDVYDPLEPLNRAIYNFNAGFDRYVFLPIVRAYELVTPDFLADRVSDFFDNLGEIPTFANALLQLKPEVAGRAATRFVVNTMFTAGLFDLAGARGGVPQLREDFGQTLGYWGVGPGPYLVIPVLGPSNLRDGTGTLTEALAWWWLTPGEISGTLAYNAVRFGLQPIDARYRVAFRYYQTGSPFEYELVRLLFTETRKLQVAN
jgi:phospholipid-binding lipoprotein MlaA